MQDNEIKVDFMEIGRSLWQSRKQLLLAMGAGALFGAIVAFSLPRTYAVKVSLLPEQGKEMSTGGLSGMASMMGLGNVTGSSETLTASLYPQLTTSTPYLLELADIQLPEGVTVGEYVTSQKKAWWSYVMGAPGALLGWIKGDKNGDALDKTISPRRLKVAEAVGQCIETKYDTKSHLLSIEATTQSPESAAALADSARVLLQAYVTRYHTQKAQVDFEDAQRLYEDRKSEYYTKQQAYAAYADQNQSTVGLSRSVTQQRLRDEATLAYQVFTQVSGQLELARAKLQQAKPVFTVVEPAYVPTVAAGPGRIRLTVGFAMLGLFLMSLWIVVAPGGLWLWKELRRPPTAGVR